MKKIIFMLENKYKSKPKTIAIGDNHNDLEMLKNSDVPCLVKNDKFIKPVPRKEILFINCFCK